MLIKQLQTRESTITESILNKNIDSGKVNSAYPVTHPSPLTNGVIPKDAISSTSAVEKVAANEEVKLGSEEHTSEHQ